MSKIFEQLLKKRGLDSSFLQVKYEDLADPLVLPDMAKAVARISQAVQAGEKILIYGDYDVDGVTASTVMADALLLAGVQPDHLIIALPNRFTDGYGMSSHLVEDATSQGVSLVITVDCGSNNREVIDGLNGAGIDTVVTDHHEVGQTLPDAVAVVNPKRSDFSSDDQHQLRDLAGVGVAFMVAMALKNAQLLPNGQEKWLLDLVLIGTICDNMLLTGDNRILCFYGFKVLAKTRRLGLKELLRLARTKNLNSDSIGFQIGPRLNAAGRLDSPDLSLKLLRSTSSAEAAALAAQLEDLNKKRKTEQIFATKEIRERAKSDLPVMVEAGNWHEGILGIIAGRLVEEYHRPAFVLTEVKDGILKGSGRSFGDFNLASALASVKDLIISGGGHAAAAGISLEKANLPTFATKINEYYQSLGLRDQAKYLQTTPDLTIDDFAEVNLGLLRELSALEPFGAGNEEPIFLLKNIAISNVTKMGADKNHLRLDVKDSHGRFLKTLCFFAPPKWLALTPDNEIELLVKFTENDFNGVKSVEARICDIIFL